MQYDRMTVEAQEAFALAHELTSSFGHPIIELEHLLLAMVSHPEGEVPRLLTRLEFDVEALREVLADDLEARETTGPLLEEQVARYVSDEVIRASEVAIAEAEGLGSDFASTSHCLLAVSRAMGSRVSRLLRDYGMSYTALQSAVQRGLAIPNPDPEEDPRTRRPAQPQNASHAGPDAASTSRAAQQHVATNGRIDPSGSAEHTSRESDHTGSTARTSRESNQTSTGALGQGSVALQKGAAPLDSSGFEDTDPVGPPAPGPSRAFGPSATEYEGIDRADPPAPGPSGTFGPSATGYEGIDPLAASSHAESSRGRSPSHSGESVATPALEHSGLGTGGLHPENTELGPAGTSNRHTEGSAHPSSEGSPGEKAPPLPSPAIPQDSALARFGQDLTEQARIGNLDPIVGRDTEIRRLIQVLSRRTKNNPCLIGEPGVGKTAVVEGLAQRIVHGDIPDGLRNKRIICLDLGTMLAGTRFRGDFEERLKQMLQEVVESNGGIILFIDELHNLMGAGASDGAMDAANLLKPPLARGELRCVGATTIDEYRRHIEKDGALERRFQPVQIAEPSVEDTVSILRGIREKYELHHGVRIQDRALVAAANLSQRYLPDRFLPDKAIDLMDEAAARIRVELDSAPALLDSAERRLIQLEVEKQALAREADHQSRQRLIQLEEEIANSREEAELLRTHWLEEKALIGQLQELQEEGGRLRAAAESALRDQEVTRYVALDQARQELQLRMQNVQEVLETLQDRQRLLREEVSAEDIAEVVARWTGIPVTRMMETEVERLLNLESRLRERIIGQDEVLRRIANAMRRSRAGLSDANRPLGSFLFMGPTGTGKTETAKALSELYFGDNKTLIRLDMSEYMEKHAVARLLGSPPGYVGYEEGSVLSRSIRQRPYSVVLFDEVEKAHPDVFNLLLQVLDDGTLTDSQGRKVDFRNTVVIMTTNLFGTTEATEGLPATAQRQAMDALEGFFRPEFLNRIDEILSFVLLGARELKAILEIHLATLHQKLEPRGIRLELTQEATARILREASDPAYGARPLRRAVQRLVTDPLSIILLQGRLSDAMRIVGDAPDLDGPLRFTRVPV